MQPRGERPLEVDGRERQRLGELRRAGDQPALVVEHDRVPVEDQLVLAADHVAERDRAEVVARPLGQHALARGALAAVVGRGARVDDQRRAGQRLVGRRRARDPQVLADRQADPRVPELQHRAAVAGLEVALLVGDAVVPQPGLAVDRLDLAVGQHRDRVEDVLAALGEADDGHDPLDPGGDRVERLARAAQEVLLEQQVLGRVAGDRQLGQQHQLGAAVARRLDVARDPRRVALEVADVAVDLGEREPQGMQWTGHRAGNPIHARRGRSTPRRTRAGAGRRDPRCAAAAARPLRRRRRPPGGGPGSPAGPRRRPPRRSAR